MDWHGNTYSREWNQQKDRERYAREMLRAQDARAKSRDTTPLVSILDYLQTFRNVSGGNPDIVRWSFAAEELARQMFGD